MKAENLTTKNKIGYLNLRTGKYKYVNIDEVDVIHPTTGNKAIKMRERFKGYNDNIYFEEVERLNHWSNENSVDFKEPKKLIKFNKTMKPHVPYLLISFVIVAYCFYKMIEPELKFIIKKLIKKL